jgi:prepilin-type processing-associated H-X9-DG protein
MAPQAHATLTVLAALLLGGAANVAFADNACQSPAGPVALG